LKDLNRELDQVRLDITDLERWRERFVGAVNQGAVVDSAGNRIVLDERRGEKNEM
jgi:tyrosinase